MALPIIPLVLCGGSGTRLWPASRASRPKQFLALFGARSTFQETILRVAVAELFGRPLVVTNREHRFLVADQLMEIGVEADVLLEPEGRDSGPAILAGARFVAREHGDDAAVLALAADHVVRDVDGFWISCRTAQAVARAGYIVTFGVKPDHAATGLGYIEPGKALAEGGFAVRCFVEKPHREAAARYLREGYYWNSGNFLFVAKALIDEYSRHEPATGEAVAKAVAEAYVDLGFHHLRAERFAGAAKRSIDYAVMEKTSNAAVVEAKFDWSDVGSWNAVRELSARDEAGNAARGQAMFVNACNNIVSSDGPLVSVVGLDDLAVIATGDAVLVARREDEAGIKALVEQLKASHVALTQ